MVKLKLLGIDWIDSTNDLIHYVLLFGLTAFTWIPIMNFFGGSVYPTLAASFVLFVVGDKLLHKALKV